MTFHSEFGEDAILFERYPDFFRVPNFSVDVGCGHPVMNSNTHWLRQLGWSGLHIDGNIGWHFDWPGGSMIHAIISTKPEVHFTSEPCKELSRIGDAEPNVKACTLESILEEYGVDRIGLLSIDAEGSEYDVLMSMNLDLHKPQFIISEYNTYGIGEDYSVMNFLVNHGYEVLFKTTANIGYRRQ